MSCDQHKSDCPCRMCHIARTMGRWVLWSDILAELYRTVVSNNSGGVPDHKLLAITAPTSLMYSFELHRPHDNDSAINRSIAIWHGESQIDVHTPGRLEPTSFKVLMNEQWQASLEGVEISDVATAVLSPFR